MFFMPYHQREPTQRPLNPDEMNRTQLRYTGSEATRLFGVYAAPPQETRRYAQHTKSSLRTGMKQSLARPQRTFNGSQAASFERASVVRQLAGEYAVQAMEPHNYYRGNVQLVGDEFSGESREYEPLRALR